MKKLNNWFIFGFFKGMPYDSPNDKEKCCVEDIEEYKEFKNKIPKKAIIQYMKKLPIMACSKATYDVITGEEIGSQAAYTDGEYRFPAEFPYYMKKYGIGIPPEYEEYLISKGVK